MPKHPALINYRPYQGPTPVVAWPIINWKLVHVREHSKAILTPFKPLGGIVSINLSTNIVLATFSLWAQKKRPSFKSNPVAAQLGTLLGGQCLPFDNPVFCQLLLSFVPINRSLLSGLARLVSSLGCSCPEPKPNQVGEPMMQKGYEVNRSGLYDRPESGY